MCKRAIPKSVRKRRDRGTRPERGGHRRTQYDGGQNARPRQHSGRKKTAERELRDFLGNRFAPAEEYLLPKIACQKDMPAARLRRLSSRSLQLSERFASFAP